MKLITVMPWHSVNITKLAEWCTATMFSTNSEQWQYEIVLLEYYYMRSSNYMSCYLLLFHHNSLILKTSVGKYNLIINSCHSFFWVIPWRMNFTCLNSDAGESPKRKNTTFRTAKVWNQENTISLTEKKLIIVSGWSQLCLLFFIYQLCEFEQNCQKIVTETSIAHFSLHCIQTGMNISWYYNNIYRSFIETR